MAIRIATYRAPTRPLYQAGDKLLALKGPGQSLGPLAARRPVPPAAPPYGAYAQDARFRACPAPGFLVDRYVY